MIISSGITRAISQGGFVEFTTVGTNQSITSAMIPAGVTRVRVHLIGGGGGSGENGGNSAFSAAGVSVMAGGGGTGNANVKGGNGGSIAAVSGVIGVAYGGSGGNAGSGVYSAAGVQGGIGIDVGVAMGGGGGGYSEYYICSCYGVTLTQGGGGQVGLLGPSFADFSGGAGGGYNSGQTLPIYGNKGGAGVSGIPAGGGGAYAMFYAPIIGATTYANAITIGNAGSGAQSGYCRIEWGSGI